ncbi:MAG: lysozyme, partial [Pleurocapsa sp.]
MFFNLNSINKHFYSTLSLLLSSSSFLISTSASQASQLNLHNKQLKITQEIDNYLSHTIASNSITKNNHQVLPATINLVKQYEGFRSYAYIDTSGLPVIGYGQSKINGKTVRMGQYITQAHADAALAKELYHIQNLVLANVKVELTPHQLGALTSLVYNAGTRVIKQSTLSRKLNAGDYEGAAAEFLRWNKANQGGKLVAMPGLT